LGRRQDGEKRKSRKWEGRREDGRRGQEEFILLYQSSLWLQNINKLFLQRVEEGGEGRDGTEEERK